MKYIDLTHSINEKMPVYPGTLHPFIKEANSIDKDGFRETRLGLVSHLGTHIDAPAHMIKEGNFLNEIPIEQFIGKALLIKVPQGARQIHLEWVKEYENDLKKVQFVIFQTGWSKFWGENSYFENFPTPENKVCEFFLNFNLYAVGFDTISIDPIDTVNFKNHITLFKKNILIIENLTNLESITQPIFDFYCFPLKYCNSDGAPVRAIAAF